MKITKDEILYINALSSFTGVNARDCIINNKVVSFIVKSDDVGKAIGKQGSNIKNLGKKLNKTVEIYGFYENVEGFLKNAFSKLKLNKIELKQNNSEKEVVIWTELEDKRQMLRNTGRFNRIKEIVKRNYGIGNIKVK